MAKTVSASEQVSGLMNKLNQKNPYAIVLVILSLILIGDFFLVLRPQVLNLAALNKKIRDAAQELHETRQHIDRLPQYQNDIRRLTQSLEKVNRHIRNKEEVPMILENISRVANAQNVRIKQIMPNPAQMESVLKTNDGQYYSIPLTLEAVSGYHDLGRFLNQLEHEEGFFSIPDFTIASSTQDPMSQEVRLTIKAVLFEQNKK